jgi:hypothetical protein
MKEKDTYLGRSTTDPQSAASGYGGLGIRADHGSQMADHKFPTVVIRNVEFVAGQYWPATGPLLDGTGPVVVNTFVNPQILNFLLTTEGFKCIVEFKLSSFLPGHPKLFTNLK